ncbi:MAG: acyltransferase family protein [Haemophilus parainfluenzae]|uniref:acyltransferase family protein n=1 Tax=Haemophilus parainfluenzae TaxID=729 RepID=UPI00290CAD72|nr:acyltransferase family protein [Haemophilus parainfluenzae]MDU6897517.1 acyltransferase family protein [Haemophilus parainfluenzae]
MQEKQHLFYVDAIKIIACISIILFHLNVHAFYANNSASLIGSLTYFNVSFGDLWISMFIIISGLTLALTSRENFSIRGFFKKRFLAIYPSFWITYILVALVFLIILHKPFGDGEYWKIILTVIGLDGFFLYKFPSYYLVGEWYTGYMLITYLFFPVLYMFFSKKPIISFIIIIAIVVCVFNIYSEIFQIPQTINPIMRLPDFFFGIIFTTFLSKNNMCKMILPILSLIYLIFSDFTHAHIPYHFHMILTGISLFLILECIFRGIGQYLTPKILDKTAYWAQYTFLAFLIHHQVLLYFFQEIPNLPNENSTFKLSIWVSVCVISFSYAIIIYPVVSNFSKFLFKRMM